MSKNSVLDAGWDDVEMLLVSKDQATADERTRCFELVTSEIECGRMRGVPETSGVMTILHRIAAAITHG